MPNKSQAVSGTILLFCILILSNALCISAAETSINWQQAENRRWPGPDIWANRLQDWSVANGKLQCAYEHGGSNWRTAHLLTYDLGKTGSSFQVDLSFDAAPNGHVGVLLGGGEGQLNYKQAAMIQGIPGLGGGILVDVGFKSNNLCIRDFGTDAEVLIPQPLNKASIKTSLQRGTPLVLSVRGQQQQDNILVSATLTANGTTVATSNAEIKADRLVGSIAIVSMGGTKQSPHRFSEIQLSGERIANHPDRTLGPVAGVLYSVAGSDLKVGVQCMSIGKTIQMGEEFGKGFRTGVQIQQQQPDGSWKPATQPVGISEPDYYGLLRIENHDRSTAADFRVVLINGPGDLAEASPYHFHVPAEPTNGQLVIGGISCTGDIGRKGLSNKKKLKPGESYVGVWSPANQWAPFHGITEPLIERKPDIVFFTGDQLYEWWPTPIDMSDAFPAEDYLYKWLIWHFSFQNVTSRVPCLLQTDDHDVWHPNLWGDGNRLMTEGWDAGGGFIKSSYFVNMVQRTMCGHNPDAYSPGPDDSGITNYFCTFRYGGVDFALLEDRKFKSAVPSVRAGQNPEMLGDAQLEMLSQWAEMPDKADARIIVSQTNYVTLNTNKTGAMFADHDSNGWPKPARDKAVELFDRAGAFLFTGDQHLASVTRMDTSFSKNGVFQFSQPAGGCIWWRWFYPNTKLQNDKAQKPDQPSWIGNFTDAFGNTFEALAVANPGSEQDMRSQKNPPDHILTAAQRAAGIGTRYRIHQGEGFGVVHVDIPNDRLTLECWPDKNATRLAPYRQFEGWPIQLKLSEMAAEQP